MKRCPQCEFIYEDDQSLCDMDGALLVLDSRTLPNLHALAPVDVPVAQVAPKAHWRHRTFPAMAALILATVLSLVYFVSQRGTAPAPVNVPSVTLPASNLVAPVSANPTPEPPPATEANGAAPAPAEESKPESKAPAAAPANKAGSKPVSKSSTTQPKPAQETKKDDSKVGSILKKTGRILKKPFKL